MARLSPPLSVGVAFLALAIVPAVAAPPEGAKVTYRDHVRPILKRHCLGCHGSGQPKADLDLSRYLAAIAGGSSGPVLVPGDASQSRLYLLVTHAEEPHMPLKRPRLAAGDLALIRRWIAGGLLATPGSKPRTSRRPPSVLAAVGESVVKRPAVRAMPSPSGRVAVRTTSRGNAVVALAGSRWAPLLAVGGHQQVLLLHAATLKVIGVLPFDEGMPHHLAFSAAGDRLLAAGGEGGVSGVVVCWDVASGRRIATLGDYSDVVVAADISPDGRRVALADERLVKIVRLDDRRVERTLTRHTEWVFALAFSPDGRRLVSGDRGGGLVLWETTRWERLAQLKGHRGAVTAAGFRPDGRVLASCGEDGSIRLWDAADGRALRNWTAHEPGVLSVAWGPAGRLASAGRDRAVRTWDSSGGAGPELVPFGDIATRVVFANDHHRLVAGDWTGLLRTWEAAAGRPAAQARPGVVTAGKRSR